jgi:hypothetical protein
MRWIVGKEEIVSERIFRGATRARGVYTHPGKLRTGAVMPAYKIAAKIDGNREIRISDLPFQAGEEVDVVIQSRKPEEEPEDSKSAQETQELEKQLPPVTRSLLGIARGMDEK